MMFQGRQGIVTDHDLTIDREQIWHLVLTSYDDIRCPIEKLICMTSVLPSFTAPYPFVFEVFYLNVTQVVDIGANLKFLVTLPGS